MRQVLLLLIVLFSQSIFAQETSKPSTFHRLLIFNEKNELMVVRVKNSNRWWVTPGWYQDNRLTIKDGLDVLAKSYGLKITTPTLRGVFTLKTDQNNEISTRLVYSAKVESGEIKAPEMIEEIRWESPTEAMKLITFPHINAQIDQLTKFPNTVWGGSQLRYQEDGVFKSKTIESFYPLATTSK